MSIKQVIIIRKDLNMRKGKMVAQGAHASMNVFFDRLTSTGPIGDVAFGLKGTITPEMKAWMEGSFTKICVSVDSELELLGIYQKAKEANLPCSLIKDVGLTEFKEPTFTCVAIGPDEEEKINKITGSLKLL